MSLAIQSIFQRANASFLGRRNHIIKKFTLINRMSSLDSGAGASAPKHTNRLAQEKSPYLLQHAHNPVDWYPWGADALQRAKDENKMIFLSVGYSTCHWCHVMEKESFENEKTAALMNKHFINVKVDREERPDIDHVYMTFVVMVSQSGGWPMSVWLTPELSPVAGGTYFPPADRWGMPGFPTVIKMLAEKWQTNSDDLKEKGQAIIGALQDSAKCSQQGDPVSIEATFEKSLKVYKRNVDKEWGGMGGAPKFPEVSKLMFMFNAFQNCKDLEILELALHTLRKIGHGGIHDHIFGGFARYSVDKRWHVPHFEKMLYDQAQLMNAFVVAHKITRDNYFLDVADGIFKYITTDLQQPDGGFYSAEDADSYPTECSSNKVEGAFYAWTFSEIQEAIEDGLEAGTIICPEDMEKDEIFKLYTKLYSLTEEGNVLPASDPHGHLLGKNVLIIFDSLPEIAAKYNIAEDNFKKVISEINTVLYKIRAKRPRPHLDDKVVTAWNGLMLSGLSSLTTIKDAPNREKYLDASNRLFDFVSKHLILDPENSTLVRTFYDNKNESSQPVEGFLDDYAFLIRGLLDYYTATSNLNALELAKNLQDTQDKLFWDSEDGGYFYSQENRPDVIVRMKIDHDGAEPCGNSVAAGNLLQLSAYYKDRSYKSRAAKLFDLFGSGDRVFGYQLPEMMSSLLLHEHSLAMVVVVGPSGTETEEFLKTVRDFYIPGLILIHFDPENPDKCPRQTASEFKMTRNQVTAYFCHHKVCQLPENNAPKFAAMLKQKFVME